LYDREFTSVGFNHTIKQSIILAKKYQLTKLVKFVRSKSEKLKLKIFPFVWI